MKELKIETKRGTLLDGVLFEAEHEADTVKSSGIAASRGSDTVLICITGIHGYKHIILAGHSLGANKVIYYLSHHHERLRVGERSSGIGDFHQVSRITHTGALLIGTYDNFTDGDPSGFLCNINAHMPTASENRLLFIERTGHTYQQKQQELADKILQLIKDWRKE